MSGGTIFLLVLTIIVLAAMAGTGLHSLLRRLRPRDRTAQAPQ